MITFEIEDGVGLICLNRSNEGNALVPEMVRKLLDAVNRCDEDSEVRAVVPAATSNLLLSRVKTFFSIPKR